MYSQDKKSWSLFLEGQMDAVESVSCIGWPGAPCTDSGEHDWGLLIIDPKRLELALAAMSMKKGASSGRKPPFLARRTKLSNRFRSLSFKNPHHAGYTYMSLPIVVPTLQRPTRF